MQPLTFIEFLKQRGYSDDADGKLFVEYKEYLHEWVDDQRAVLTEDRFNERVEQYLVETLKTITLSYSSYEEQHMLANVDWNDTKELKQLVPFYSRKILEICKFYRTKREGIRAIAYRNSFKGSTKSVEEIVYQKIFDWLFDNRNIMPSIKEIKRDFSVSIEQFVDTYAEYFNIPRDRKLQDKTRADYDMITANMNDVDYRYYLKVEEVVGGMLYQGNVWLNEIPLIAQLALDLNQDCVGDLLAMKNTLSYKSTINQVELTEQVNLKRKLYEKFLGVDLWYAYKDKDGKVAMDVLCRAKNPTGNLLNCDTPDTATTFSGQLKLLSHIGLFFKTDKCSIIKVNARTYSWQLDESKLEEDSWYVFPDPNKYGDIGTNKTDMYPILMEYKTIYDIRNLSSGNGVNDPIVYIGDQNWRSYYSKQDDDFQIEKNKNFEYSFTGVSSDDDGKAEWQRQYTQDIYGNQFGVFSDDDIDAHVLSEGQSFGESSGVVYNSQKRKRLVEMWGGPIKNPEPFLHNAPKLAYDEQEELSAITLPLHGILIK